MNALQRATLEKMFEEVLKSRPDLLREPRALCRVFTMLASVHVNSPGYSIDDEPLERFMRLRRETFQAALKLFDERAMPLSPVARQILYDSATEQAAEALTDGRVWSALSPLGDPR